MAISSEPNPQDERCLELYQQINILKMQYAGHMDELEDLRAQLRKQNEGIAMLESELQGARNHKEEILDYIDETKNLIGEICKKIREALDELQNFEGA